MRRVPIIAVVSLLVASCYTVEIDTVDGWCAQLLGEDLYQRAPFWAAFPGVRFHGDAIRDDYARELNAGMMEVVDGRAERMVWREGSTLHIENLANLMDLEHETVIDEWRVGIGRAVGGSELDQADRCLFGGVASMFDTVTIHSAVHDGLQWADEWTTELSTDRQARLGNPL